MSSFSKYPKEMTTCYDMVIESIARTFKLDYELMMSDALIFKFTENKNKSIGECISKFNCSNMYFLMNYHGIKINNIKDNDSKTKLDLIGNELLNERPVIIGIDTYHCRWDRNYRIHHNIEHCCIATEFVANLGLLCTDPFNKVYKDLITFEELEQGGFWMQTVEIIEHRTISYEDIVHIMECIVYSIMACDCYTDLKKFAHELLHISPNIEFEKYKNNIWHSPLIFKLGRIIIARIRFSILLEYLFKRSNLIDKKKHLIYFFRKKLPHMWDIVRLMIIKYSINYDDRLLKIIFEKINEIINCEEKSIKILWKLFKNE